MKIKKDVVIEGDIIASRLAGQKKSVFLYPFDSFQKWEVCYHSGSVRGLF